MIWVYLDNFLRRMLTIFGKRPAPVALARINPNAKCPGCGAEDGELRAVTVMVGTTPTPLIRHKCKVCGGRMFEKTVMKTNADVFWPALPQTEQDRLESAALQYQRVN